MKTEKQTPKPFDISVEELEPMLDATLARKAEAEAKEARRVQREVERQNKRRLERERAIEAEADRVRFVEICEWMASEPE